MPRLTESRVPSYRLHKQSGQALVTLNGRDICLGKHGTPQSKAEYNRLLAEWLANGRFLPPSPQVITVLEVADAFLKHAEAYYRDADGKVTSEVHNYRSALRPLLKLYADLPAAEFGPLCLKAVREKMIEKKWCRKSVNDQTARIKHVFKWAVENELVPPSIYHGLIAVAGLKVGRSGARESAPVRPVSQEQIDAILKHVSRQVSAMIRLQFLTGMRPGEVCAMRGMDMDTSGEPWLYKLTRHKTAHHGHDRVIYLGPQAQEIIRPFLRPNFTEYLFSPAEAEQERREIRHARRKTPASYGNVPGSNRKLSPKRRAADADGTARFIIDCLSPEQTAAIAKAILRDVHLAAQVDIKLPAHFVRGEGLPPEILTTERATFFRHAECEKPARVFANTGDDEDQSLKEVSQIGSPQLQEHSELWVRVAADGLLLTPDHMKWWERSLLGLQELRSFPLDRVAEYVLLTRRLIKDEGLPLIPALGAALPALRLPKDSYYFNRLNDKAKAQPGRWRALYSDAYRKRACFLVKRTPSQVMLGEEDLQNAWEKVHDSVPDANVMPMQLRANLGNRLILRVDSEGTSEIALGAIGAERLLGRGHLLAKLEGTTGLVYGQVPLVPPDFAEQIVAIVRRAQ